jgi:hypothetical protein
MFDLLEDAADWFSSPTKMKATAHEAISSVATTVEDFGHGIQDEGLFGLADPVGMLDRQDAKRDLAPYFAIEPDDFQGPRNHNEVTRAELDEMARTYSDIRLGRGDLTINTSQIEDPDAADAYREEVMGDIGHIMRSTAGREQIEFLGHSPAMEHTTIRPSVYREGEHAGELASVGRYEDMGPDDNRITFSNSDAREDVPDGAGFLMLAHEMEHAHQHIMGTHAEGEYGVPGDDPFTMNQERATVGLTHSDAAHPSSMYSATENRIRFELMQIGEDWLPRTHYDTSFAPIEGEEHDDKKRAKAWDSFLTGPDHPGFL